MTEYTLILPAAGSSSRFGSNKLFALLAGEAVITRTLGAFARHPSLKHVVIATGYADEIQSACETVIAAIRSRGIAVDFCPGGASRAESVRNAAMAAPADVEWLAVHDAARPLVSSEVIDRALSGAAEHGAAVPALPVSVTIKEATGPLPAKVSRTLPRATLWGVQTPQVMRRTDLLEAFARCPIPLDQITDDLQLLELNGQATWLVTGDERNLKLTTSGDMKVAESFLRARG